jgi:hypothetical protein
LRVVTKVYEWHPAVARARCVAVPAALCHHRPAAARVRDTSSRQYEQCVAALRRELDIDPSDETKQLLLALAPAR